MTARSWGDYLAGADDGRTTNGPLRLSWPRLQLWARADQKAARTTKK